MSLRNRGMTCHSGDFYQTGRGFGSTFRGLMNNLAPYASKGVSIGKRILESDLLKNLSSEAVRTGKDAITNIALDVLTGEKTLAESGKEEIDDVKKKISSALKNYKEKRSLKRKQLLSEHNHKLKIPKQFNLLDD